MKKKRTVIVVAVTFVIVLLGIVLFTSINNSSKKTTIKTDIHFSDPKIYDEYLNSDISEKTKEKIRKLQVSPKSFAGVLVRELKIVLGDLPKNQNRITKQQATKIIEKYKISDNNYKFKDIIEELNKIHGAPDYVGGSGLSRTEYHLDSDKREVIYILGVGEPSSISYAKYDNNGNQIEHEYLTGDKNPPPSSSKLK